MSTLTSFHEKKYGLTIIYCLLALYMEKTFGKGTKGWLDRWRLVPVVSDWQGLTTVFLAIQQI